LKQEGTNLANRTVVEEDKKDKLDSITSDYKNLHRALTPN